MGGQLKLQSSALVENANRTLTLCYIDITGARSYELVYEESALACAHMVIFEMEEFRLSEKEG